MVTWLLGRSQTTRPASILGPRPVAPTGLENYPECDLEVAALARDLWGDTNDTATSGHSFGKGRVIRGKTARQVLLDDGIRPDFEFSGANPGVALDYIHRRDGRTPGKSAVG